VGRTSGPKKFHSSTRRDFFNSIRAQSVANWSLAKNREFSEKFSEKQASIGLTALGHRKLDCNPHHLRETLALSCYFAKQAFGARQQAIRCSTSGFFEPQTGHNARRIAHGTWAVASCLARLLGCLCGLRVSVVENRRKQTPVGNHFR
jgi:branched-subunit amino acid ABC-type transport system permease component